MQRQIRLAWRLAVRDGTCLSKYKRHVDVLVYEYSRLFLIHRCEPGELLLW